MAEETEVVKAETTVEKVTDEKTVPIHRFQDAIQKNKDLETKLKAFEDAQKTEKQKADEEKAKATGDYSKLMETVKEKEEKMKQRVSTMALQTLGIKHGIAKADYVNLFNAKLEISDDLELTNFVDVEKEFETFKKDNPSLFATGKKVPETDNRPSHQIKNDVLESSLSAFDKIRLAIEEQNKSK